MRHGRAQRDDLGVGERVVRDLAEVPPLSEHLSGDVGDDGAHRDVAVRGRLHRELPRT
jgi:hypothetical protein